MMFAAGPMCQYHAEGCITTHCYFGSWTDFPRHTINVIHVDATTAWTHIRAISIWIVQHFGLCGYLECDNVAGHNTSTPPTPDPPTPKKPHTCIAYINDNNKYYQHHTLVLIYQSSFHHMYAASNHIHPRSIPLCKSKQNQRFSIYWYNINRKPDRITYRGPRLS